MQQSTDTPEMRLRDTYLVENHLSILRVSSCQESFLLLLIDLIVTWGKVCQRQIFVYNVSFINIV